MITQTPSELRVSKDKKTLTVSFPGGDSYQFSAEMLRVFSPSAEVQGHSPDQKKLIAGKKNVEIMKIEPIGNYAIRITFDDMHDTGLFSWAWFIENGAEMENRWVEYINALAEHGLTR